MDKDSNGNKSGADKKSSASSTPGQAESNPLLDAAFGNYFFFIIFFKIICRVDSQCNRFIIVNIFHNAQSSTNK